MHGRGEMGCGVPSLSLSLFVCERGRGREGKGEGVRQKKEGEGREGKGEREREREGERQRDRETERQRERMQAPSLASGTRAILERIMTPLSTRISLSESPADEDVAPETPSKVAAKNGGARRKRRSSIGEFEMPEANLTPSGISTADRQKGKTLLPVESHKEKKKKKPQMMRCVRTRVCVFFISQLWHDSRGREGGGKVRLGL
jgi:hypothetical protein